MHILYNIITLISGTIEVEINQPPISNGQQQHRMSTLKHKYSQMKLQMDSQKAVLQDLNQNLTDIKNSTLV